MTKVQKIPYNYFQQANFAELELYIVSKTVIEIDTKLKDAGLKTEFIQIHDEFVLNMVEEEKELVIEILAEYEYIMKFIEKVF